MDPGPGTDPSMTPPPAGAPHRLSRRFYLPAALLVAAGAERVVAGARGPGWLVALGVVLALAGVVLGLVVHRGRRRG